MPYEIAERRPSQGLPRIMMIDDETANLHIVKLILMRENFKSDLIMFQSGEEALEHLRTNRVDLVLLDLAMPGMDGFELMTQLRADPATAEIPVIFLTAFQDTEYILKAFELGATDFIGKPIISPILTARIRAVLQTQALKNELKLRNEALVGANRLKDELLSIVSHDLRSPLSAIELLCQFLQEPDTGDPAQSPPDLINRILNQSRLARRLVENLLNLNRIEEGILAPAASFFRIGELVLACAEDEKTIVQSRGIDFKVDSPAEDLLCFGDREMIAQVLRNLLGNAIKFTRSSVSLGCTLVDFSEDNGGRLRLTVADDGEGIPAEQLPRLFEKYGKGDRRGGGSGLGLYIAKNIMQLHGGSIRLRSREHEGTEFYVELPNVYRPPQLPDLSAFSESPVLVLSNSKATGQMLEGLLIEGGLLDVTLSEVDSNAPADEPGGAWDLTLLDLESVGPEELERVPGYRTQSPTARWIYYGGSDGDAQSMAKLTPPPLAHMRRPVNPLQLLRTLSALFGGAAPPSASAMR
jgi:two-component system sensor histidine kinase/response regulator